jgi:hypothetical protein
MDGDKELGKSEVPLNNIENQEEYELDLEIPDEKDETQILIVLHTKVTFIWSYHQKYEELSQQAKNKAEGIKKNVYQKTKEILMDLDKPFNLLSYDQDKLEKGAFGKGALWKTNDKEFEYADKIEGQLKTSLGLKQIKWLTFLKASLLVLIALSLFNLFTRADFINILIPLYILATLSTAMSDKMFSNFQIFITASTVTLIFDLLWLIFRDSTNVADAGGENTLRRFVYFTSMVTFVVKTMTTITLWVIKLKIERGQNEGLI